MKIQLKQIAVIILVLYIKSGQGKRECKPYRDPKVNGYSFCRIFNEQVYEGIASKENGTEDTVGQCQYNKVQRVKNFSGHALEVLLERKCPADHLITEEQMMRLDICPFMYLRSVKFEEYYGESYRISKDNWSLKIIKPCLGECDIRLVQDIGLLNLKNITWTFTASGGIIGVLNYTDFTRKVTARGETLDTKLSFEETIFGRPSTSIGSDVTTSAPPNTVDRSLSSGKTSYIEWTQVIHTGSTIIFLLIITAVSITCVKCYVDRRLRTLNKATNNEHEPLHNHNDVTYIPMEDLNVHRTLVPGELQKSDPDDHNGNADSSPESPEGQCESETEGKTVDQSNDSFHTAGPFCSCCGRHWRRCNKRNVKQSMARVQPHQKVNEIPPFETVEAEVLVDEYSNFSSSILYDPESHGSTNTVDEETTHIKSVYNNEQVSSTVEQTNEAEGTCFEESNQADLHNEDHMTTGIPAEGDLFRAYTRLGRTNHDEEQMTAENEDDVEEV